MSLYLNAMSELGLCEPGGASAGAEPAASPEFCSLITANLLCAQTEFVHTFPLPPQYSGEPMVEPAASQTVQNKRTSPLFLWFWEKYAGCGEKLLFVEEKQSWKSFHPHSGRMLGEIFTEYSELT